MNFSIRAAEASDSGTLSDLALSASHLVARDQDAARDFLKTLSPDSFAERLASDAFRHFIGFANSRPVGFVALRDGSHLHHLFVRPDCHGLGFGQRLWTHALASASAPSFTVNASVSVVPFYQRLGFVATGPAASAGRIEFVPMRLQVSR